MNIQENTHEFRNCDDRMRIVELNGDPIRKFVQAPMITAEVVQDVL